MIIDSHEHMMLPTEMQLQMMDAAGIDKTILFCTAPHPEKASSRVFDTPNDKNQRISQ